MTAITAAAERHTTLVIEQTGRLGNHMLQLMLARAVQRYSRREVRICGYDMPAWGLKAEVNFVVPRSAPQFGGHLTDARYVARMIDRYAVRYVRMNNLCLRFGSLLPASEYVDLFPPGTDQGTPFSDDTLVINVRAGEILKDVHPNYGPLPFSYYRTLIAETGLNPLFIGEIKAEPYASALRAAFPDARFFAGDSPIDDFQALRRAKNLAASVSTFGWLASMLSGAKVIHVPVAGFLDPLERPDIDALATDDPRMVFRQIPPTAWSRRFSDFEGRSEEPFRRLSVSEILDRKQRAADIVRWRTICSKIGLQARCIRHSALAKLDGG